MATFQEVLQKMLDETSVKVVGIVKSINEYVQKETKKSYWSVDVEVKGHKNLLTLKLPDRPSEDVKMYDIKTFAVQIRPGYQGKGYEFHVIGAA